jgi:hypothetical protein
MQTRILFLVLSGSGDSIIAFMPAVLTLVTSFVRERCHVSFSSNSIIFSLCFIMLYYALLCFIMLLLCFHYAFLGTRLIKVSFFGDITYLRTIFQIRGFLCLPAQCGPPRCKPKLSAWIGNDVGSKSFSMNQSTRGAWMQLGST